jgi:hypothetical protein
MLKDIDRRIALVKNEMVIIGEKSSHPAREDYPNR